MWLYNNFEPRLSHLGNVITNLFSTFFSPLDSTRDKPWGLMLGRQVPSTEPHPLPPDGTFKNDMMRMSILPACQCISGASSDCEGQRTVLDARELEL